jgi:hypothetical protein
LVWGSGFLPIVTPPEIACMLPGTRSKLLIVNKIKIQDIGNCKLGF